jgi:O-antigen ligase
VFVEKRLGLIFYSFVLFIVIFSFVPFKDYSIAYLIAVMAFAMLAFFVEEAKVQFNGPIFIRHHHALWAIFFLLVFISLFYTSETRASIYYVVSFFCTMMIGFVLSNQLGWQAWLEKCLFFFSSFHVLVTILSLFFPKPILKFASVILSPEQYQVNATWLSIGAHIGISGDNSMDAFYITIFLAIVMGRLLLSKKRKGLYAALLLLGIFALVLTTKRGAFLGNAAALIFATMLLLGAPHFSKIIKYILVIFITALVVYYVLMSVPAAKNLFSRFQSLNDITTGRLSYYQIAWNNFLENPLFGSGINTTKALLGGNDAHNIYIQLLSELGIVGFLVCFSAMLSSMRYVKNMLTAYRRVLPADSEEIRFCFTSLYFQIYFMTYGLTGNPLYNGFIFLIYFCMISIPLHSRKEAVSQVSGRLTIGEMVP